VFLRQLNLFIHDESVKPKPIQQHEIYKMMTIITLRQILVRLTMSVYSNEETEKTNASLTITVAAVMKILDQYIKAIPTVKDVEQQKRAQI